MLDSAALGYQPVTIFLVVAGCLGLLFALALFLRVRAVGTQIVEGVGEAAQLKDDGEKVDVSDINSKLTVIYDAVRGGAESFLWAEYRMCFVFVILFAVVIVVLLSHIGPPKSGAPDNGANSQGFNWTIGGYAVLSYGVGALCSIFTGYISMKVAVYSNVRTCVAASKLGEQGWKGAFSTAMNAGAADGFLLCACALLVLFFLCSVFELHFGSATSYEAKLLFEAIAGFGLGGSSIAMFGRVGGGIFTKAADVGSDLAGKVVENIPEDDPRNPGVIADNVGDNVGDVAGMGSDLFGSFAEASCAALIVGATSEDLVKAGWGALMFPLVISATGIYIGIITHFFATDIWPVKGNKDVLRALKMQLALSTIFITAAMWPVIMGFLPADFEIEQRNGSTVKVFFSICVGLWGGCIIGFVTEYFTAYTQRPTQEVAESTRTGPATVIIYGIALGYRSAVIPIIILCVDIFVSFYLLGMYGVALCALGMLSSLSTCLTIDVYGPICDNGGGFAEMAGMHKAREITDELDAAGNTTAAIGKGFAIGSAALVSLSLLGAFVTRVRTESEQIMCHQAVDILQPITFACLVFGAMIPYWFSALTLKSVGKAAMAMVMEIKRQFREIEGLLEGAPGVKPETGKCIKIATESSLKEMILPGLLIIFTPIIVGVLLGVNALAGFLCGSMSSGVQIAISMSNTGGAWDNAKKYVEKGALFFDSEVNGKIVVDEKPQQKGSDAHKAAVVGDTVGDPFKDTSGPAINIVMKLMAIISLVFADFFMSINDGHGGFNIVNTCSDK